MIGPKPGLMRREQVAKAFGDPDAMKTYEILQELIDQAPEAIQQAQDTATDAQTKVNALKASVQFVVMTATGLTAAERVLTGTAAQISVTDGGAGGNATLALVNTAVTPATYGDATHVGTFTVDAHGRLTGAASVAITFPASGATAFTGLSDVPGSYSGATLKAVRVNAGETALEFYTPGAGSGTVTSVGLTAPAIFTVTVSPITTSGSLTFTLATQSANLIWAGPTTGSAAAPTFRAMVVADLPTVDVPHGGTGAVTLTNHGVLLGQATAAIVATAAGTAGNVLKSGGASADPSFGALDLTNSASATATTTTWTPVIKFGGGTTGQTYSTQAGWYIQIGKMVVAAYNVSFSAKGSSTGNATLEGFPVAAKTGANFSVPPGFQSTGVADVICHLDAAATVARILTAGGAALTNANFTNTTSVFGVITYFVD